MFGQLCSRFDALSNYHFTPRPVSREDVDEITLKNVPTAPAISVEEVLPTYVSDGRRAAPEEVYEKKVGRDGVLKGDSELTQQERKAQRAIKKSLRNKERKE